MIVAAILCARLLVKVLKYLKHCHSCFHRDFTIFALKLNTCNLIYLRLFKLLLSMFNIYIRLVGLRGIEKYFLAQRK